jgi:hypothetical protein
MFAFFFADMVIYDIKIVQDWNSLVKPYMEFIVALDMVVEAAQVIVFGLGAIKKDWLFT